MSAAEEDSKEDAAGNEPEAAAEPPTVDAAAADEPRGDAADEPRGDTAEEEAKDAAVQDEEEDDAALATFDRAAWAPSELLYGLAGLLGLRDAMLPIEKPEEVRHLKFLVCPREDRGSDEKPARAPDADRLKGSRTESGKGRGKGKAGAVGRYIPEMGKTEPLPMNKRNQWWRNVSDSKADVIIRESFALTSEEVGRVPYGHYVRQQGPVEVFVNGQAQGLQRMPVQPTGWVTVDAQSVGGPRYLEPVTIPRWQVVFASGSNRGDIVVRSRVSLDSEEVAVLYKGNFVEQVAPSEILEDGIIRMSIQFTAKGRGEDPSSASRPPKKLTGWVTCDATAQGGPRFFAPAPPATVSPAARVEVPSQPAPRKEQAEESAGASKENGGEGGEGGAAAPAREGGWAKNRTWKVSNLEEKGSIAVVLKPEPFDPSAARKVPPNDILVSWLKNGDEVEQVGHSKKVRGYMVMPVKILDEACTAQTFDYEGQQVHGWVTRRLVDKQREGESGVWFTEINIGDEKSLQKKRQERKGQRKGGEDA